MAVPAPRHTGVLVVRAWLEDECDDGLRARITWTVDLSRRDVTRVAASGQQEIQRVVRTWLDALLADDDSHTGR
jgi:hypothetical protein